MKTWKSGGARGKWEAYSGVLPRTGVTPILPDAEHPVFLLQAKGISHFLGGGPSLKRAGRIFMPAFQQLYLFSSCWKDLRQAVSCDFTHR